MQGLRASRIRREKGQKTDNSFISSQAAITYLYIVFLGPKDKNQAAAINEPMPQQTTLAMIELLICWQTALLLL